MIVELVSTGTELLLGEIVNTNAPFLARQLNEFGFDVLYQTVVGDNRSRMGIVLSQALQRADIIITSGGLGPTQGDITKEVTAALCGLELYEDERSLQRIKACFRQFHPENPIMPENNIRQAMMPQGAIVIDNECGTAPGVIVEYGDKIIINLPGPPHELQQMFTSSIQPYLLRKFPATGTIISRILHVFGIGESALEDEIHDLVVAQDNPTLALLVRQGEIFMRLTAKAGDRTTAAKLLDGLEQEVRAKVGKYIFGVDADSLPAAVGRELRAKQLTVAFAESCTGGLASSMLTDIPGSSDYLRGSIVCYSNIIKQQALGVPMAVLDEFGAVSKETAELMARGMRQSFGTDLGVGITGIAGPDGATPDKPVGLVYIAVDGEAGTRCFRYVFKGSRIYNKARAAKTALHQLRQYIAAI